MLTVIELPKRTYRKWLFKPLELRGHTRQRLMTCSVTTTDGNVTVRPGGTDAKNDTPTTSEEKATAIQSFTCSKLQGTTRQMKFGQ